LPIKWAFALAGAIVAVAVAILSRYLITLKDKEIENKKTEIQKAKDELDNIRENEAAAKLLFNHYEELVVVGQL
jgi:uncharacterized membrane-anchored protein YhcB (DUF1043 family)